jgi:hypothetical protein
MRDASKARNGAWHGYSGKNSRARESEIERETRGYLAHLKAELRCRLEARLRRRGGGFEGAAVLERWWGHELGFARQRAAAAGFGSRGALAAAYKGVAARPRRARRKMRGGGMAGSDSSLSPARSGEGDGPDGWGSPVVAKRERRGGQSRPVGLGHAGVEREREKERKKGRLG